MQVAGILVPLLKFYFHEEVRKAAVSGIKKLYSVHFQEFFPYTVKVIYNHYHNCLIVIISNTTLAMPELLRSAKLAIEKGQSQGRDLSYLKFLTDSIIPSLVEALHKVNCYPSSLLCYNGIYVCFLK